MMKSCWLIGIGVVAAGTAVGVSYMLYKRYVQDIADEGFVEEAVSAARQKRILVLGLNGAGKSQVLAALAQKTICQETTPTEGFNVLSVQTGNIAFDFWEVGGAENFRQYWPNFIQDTDVLMFVVDSLDRGRFPDAYNEMHKLLGDSRLLKTPFIILAHKQDLSGAASKTEVKEALGLEDLRYHRVKVLSTSVTTSGGIKGINDVNKTLLQMTGSK